MKYFNFHFLKAFILMLGLCCFGSSAQAQTFGALNTYSRPAAKLKVDKGTTLKQALEILERQFGVVFLYRTDAIGNTKISNTLLLPNNVEESLELLLKGQGLAFSYLNPKTYGIYIKRNAKSDKVPVIFQQVEGTVTDASTGETLPGVNIVVKDTNTGTSTDAEGRFELTVPSLNDTLIFSFIGFQRLEVPLNGRTELNVEMQEQAFVGEELVVVGYGVQRKRDVTGSISSVDEEQLSQRSPTNAFEAIQGQMSGVQITTSSGAPGSSASVRIRGVSTFSGGADPLYIVDGQPVDNIDQINPNSIESIEVLKDGASAAIYGSRSANGVVIVTTKGGETGEASVDVSYQKGLGTTRHMPVATSNERLDYEVFRDVIGHRADLDTLNQMFYYNNNFQDILYRTAHKDEVNISVSAGTENTSIYWNTGFLNQEGVIKTTKFSRLNSRLNVDHTFNDWLTMRVRTGLTYESEKNIAQDLESHLVGQMILSKPPWSTLYDADGSLLPGVDSYRGRWNPLRTYSLMDIKGRTIGGNLFNSIEMKLIKGLRYSANFGVDFSYIRNTRFFPEFVLRRNDEVRSSFNSSLAWNGIHESYFNYENSYNKHQISVVGGFSIERWGNPQEEIGGLLASSLIPTLNNATEIYIGDTNTLDQNDHSMASVFVRLNYSYEDKYLLSGTVRRDGSSRFGPENRWGNFPSISAGWRFSEEAFMDGIGFITDAKIRASYAITGNERISNRDYEALLSTGNFYNGINGVGLSSRLANPAIKWEQTNQSNFGLDLEAMEGRLNFTVDYYIKNTQDLLANRPLPAQSGVNNVRVNLGDVQNKGFEFGIQAIPYDRNGLRWSTNFNFSTNINEVQNLADGVPIISNSHITQEGSPLGSFYGYNIKGVFAYDESNAFTADGEQLTPNFDGGGNFTGYTLNGNAYSSNVEQITVGGVTAGGGDFYWEDLNGDFAIDGEDRQIIGNPYPKYFGGFRNEISYKGITFSFLFDYQFDVQVLNDYMQSTSMLQANSLTPMTFVLDNLWEGPGDETAVFPGGPRRSQNNLTPTSYWVEDADYIKLRNIKFSYNLPVSLVSKLKMTRLTLYGSINNALTWTNYRGFDPEVNFPGNPLSAGVDHARYPRTRQFIFGININL